MVVMLRVTAQADPLAREDLAFALSVLLLGLLMMVTRRNAVGQVLGFMSLENGLILAATGAKGMRCGGNQRRFSVLIAFIVIGIFLFRIRERFDTVDVQASTVSEASSNDHDQSFDPGTGHSNRRGGPPSLFPELSTFLASQRDCEFHHAARRPVAVYPDPEPNSYFLIDDLNIVFIVLNSFVGFTTSVFSATYIAMSWKSAADSGLSEILPRHVPDHDVRNESGAGREQYRPDVGGDRGWRLSPRSSWSASTARMRRWSGRGNISSSAASASPLRYSARSSFIWQPSPWLAKVSRAWSGRCLIERVANSIRRS